MDLTADEIAGVADLFGGLTRDELGQGLAELAFKNGEEYDEDAFEGDIESALSAYQLVAVDPDQGTPVEDPLLVAGPVSFPELPDGATDLPHILDIETRTVDRETAATTAQRRFEAEASKVAKTGDSDRIEQLLDVSYELEAWGSMDLSTARSCLDRADE